MSNWGFEKIGDKVENWPKDENGTPVSPAFLEHITGTQLDIDMELNVLSAFDIPAITAYPNNGDFGRLILGFAGTGVDVYVPETMLDDARNILSSAVDAENSDTPLTEDL